MNKTKKISISLKEALSKIKVARKRLFPDFNLKSNQLNWISLNYGIKNDEIGSYHFTKKQLPVHQTGKTFSNSCLIVPVKKETNQNKTITNYDFAIKSKPNYILNAGLMPLSMGLITMLYLCNESINKSQ